MKHLYAVIVLLGFLSVGNAQIINFPDANFKNYLLLAIEGSGITTDINNNSIILDANGDGEIQISEAAAVHYLRVGYNSDITNLTGVEYFTNLTSLEIYYTNVQSLNASSLTNLIYLSCNNNAINSLNVDGLVNLKQLNCRDNDINSINLNQLTSLEALLCDNNSITSIDINGLLNLEQLYVGYNNLTSLSVQNCPQLITLWFNNNFILSFDFHALTGLTSLYCQDNLLTSIDVSNSPNLLEFFFSGNNQLVTINMKNGSYQTIDYSIGLQNLRFVCADESEIDNIQTIFNSNNYTNVNLNTYCSFVPGGDYYTIQGNSKLDLNLNGCDTSDFNFSNLNLSITDGTNTGNFISNTIGNYSIPVQTGTQTITPVLENPSYFTISPTSFSVTFPNQSAPFVQNFCITPNGSRQDVETWIIPLTPARPGFDSRYKIMYKNKGNTTVSGSLVFAFDDDYMDFISAMPLQNNQSFSLLNWNYSNLLPFETREIEVKFNINSPMETPAVTIGDLLKFSSTIFPLTGDEYSSDNANGLNQIVVGSLDPNDKTCVEGNFVEPEMIGQYVHYVIRFENTGTFAAENIVVKDIIDETKFDISTLVPLDASHDFTTRITGSKVEFIFENINLPFDDENNDGYVAFKIKTKSTLTLGNTFSNTANIYFDYNFPIVTNTTATTIQRLANQNFEFSNYFTLYPNPVKDILHIKSTNDLSVYSVTIYNPLGQVLQVITNPTQEIDVTDLKTGNYFIKVTTDKGISSSRFVKI